MRKLLFLCLLLSFGSKYCSAAIIPANITSNLTVANGDYSVGDCEISNGATLTIPSGVAVTFNGHVTVDAGSEIAITSGILYMAPEKRIRLMNGNNTTPTPAMFNGNSSLITSTSSGFDFWAGFETMRGVTSMFPTNAEQSKSSKIILTNCTVEKAINAILNYNSDDPVIDNTSGGGFQITQTSFVNNVCAVMLYNDNSDGIQQFNDRCNFTDCRFELTADFDSGLTPNVFRMVNLTNCNGIIFRSCKYIADADLDISGNPIPNQAQFYTGMGGTDANVKILLSLSPFSGDRTLFSGLKCGLYFSNSMQTNKIQQVYDADFYCDYGVLFSGCYQPRILNNIFQPRPFINGGEVFVYLNNCTPYRLEGNVIKNYGSDANNAGIVIENCGGAANLVYRNRLVGTGQSLQSIGTNKTSNEGIGMKFLCNDITSLDDGFDISIMTSGSPIALYEGISRYQYLYTDSTAGNKFQNNGTDLTYQFKNYYVETGTNNLGTGIFLYKQNASDLLSVPTNRTGPFTLSNAPYSLTCPPRYETGNTPLIISLRKPLSFSAFSTRLSNIENQISAIEEHKTQTEEDGIQLDLLYTAQSHLIDSVVDYYSDKGQQDSVMLVFEQTTKGFHYKIYLAMAYLENGRYDDAISLIKSLPGKYNMNPDESVQMDNLAAIIPVKQWLKEHKNDWAHMPDGLKKEVYQIEANDRMFAGALARTLLAFHENKKYNSRFIRPEPNKDSQNGLITHADNSIYPNPASQQIQVKCKAGKGLFLLMDVTGKVVLKQNIQSALTTIDVAGLISGIYFAQITDGNKTIFQDKLVKQ